MNIKVLVFQNKKLAERLEVMKLDEERLRERLDEVKKQRVSEYEILSLINRHWTQVRYFLVSLHCLTVTCSQLVSCYVIIFYKFI